MCKINEAASRLIFFLCIIIISFCTIAEAVEQEVTSHGNPPRLKNVLNNINKAVQKNNYLPLKQYVSSGKLLTWGVCGPSDGEPIKYTVDKMIDTLKRNAANGNISVNQDVEIEPWNKEETVFMIVVATEGWTGEYPYLSFVFQYSEDAAKWDWLGVCYSSGPPVKITENGKYENKYTQQPVLPRKGPRIFKDYSTLQARIKEIVQFRAFDALKPYAVKNVLTFEQCNLEMMNKDQIVGKSAPVQEVISFLKKNVPKNSAITTPDIHHSTYYETSGWSGQYPFIAFWFSKKDKGWELSGVSYCKTRHFDLFKSSLPLK